MTPHSQPGKSTPAHTLLFSHLLPPLTPTTRFNVCHDTHMGRIYQAINQGTFKRGGRWMTKTAFPKAMLLRGTTHGGHITQGTWGVFLSV